MAMETFQKGSEAKYRIPGEEGYATFTLGVVGNQKSMSPGHLTIELPRKRNSVYRISWNPREKRFVEETENFGKTEIYKCRPYLKKFKEMLENDTTAPYGFFGKMLAGKAALRLSKTKAVFHLDKSAGDLNETMFVTKNAIVDVLHHDPKDFGIIHVYTRDSGKTEKPRKRMLVVITPQKHEREEAEPEVALGEEDAHGHVRAYKALQDVHDYLSMRRDQDFTMLRRRMMAGLKFAQRKLLARITPEMREEALAAVREQEKEKEDEGR